MGGGDADSDGVADLRSEHGTSSPAIQSLFMVSIDSPMVSCQSGEWLSWAGWRRPGGGGCVGGG